MNNVVYLCQDISISTVHKQLITFMIHATEITEHIHRFVSLY